MALGLGPWMAVEIPDLIDKVTMITKYGLVVELVFRFNPKCSLFQGVITYKEKAEGASS